jgi:ABC-type molybdate transport system substrate-binding protein
MNYLKLLPALLISLVLVGCTNEKPTIKVTNQTNQTGGSLQITGSGFTAQNPISVSILNAPGLTAPWSEKAGKADGNSGINVTVTYSYAGSGKLPGCQTGNTAVTPINVTAADSKTNALAASQVDVINCEWAVPQVSSHQ